MPLNLRALRICLLLCGAALAGCVSNDREAFYTSALTQEAWFALQAEPAPDAWASFERTLLLVPAELRAQVRETAIQEAKERAAKN